MKSKAEKTPIKEVEITDLHQEVGRAQSRIKYLRDLLIRARRGEVKTGKVGGYPSDYGRLTAGLIDVPVSKQATVKAIEDVLYDLRQEYTDLLRAFRARINDEIKLLWT